MVWDDGDDTLAEPRAPYPHAREVAMLRAHQLRCAALIGGYARTAEAQALVRSGWAHDLVATATGGANTRRRAWSRWRTVATRRNETPPRGPPGCPRWRCRPRGTALEAGRPVLVQVPRRGYVPALACDRCRTIARCRHCTGPLSLPARDAAGAVCRWCGRADPHCAAPDAAPTPCAPSWSAPAAPPRNSVGRFPASPSSRRAATRWSRRCPRNPPSSCRHARRGTGRCRRLRRGTAARQLGAARAPGPAGRRGRAAPLDGSRRTGPQPRRRRGRRGGRASRRSPPCRR